MERRSFVRGAGLAGVIAAGTAPALVHAQTALESSFGDRTMTARNEKVAIGRRAAQLFQPGDSIFIDSGSTTAAFAEARDTRATRSTGSPDHGACAATARTGRVASPVASMIGRALDQAAGSGKADLRLKLNLPLAAIEKSGVQGSVTLADNDLQFSQDSPRLTKARGVVNFSESGFSLSGAQARMLGGDPESEASRAHARELLELGEVICGRHAGRSTDDQITLFESQGMAIQDLAVAVHLEELARELGVGIELPYGS